MVAEPVRVGSMPRPNGELSQSQGFRVYDAEHKSVTLKGNAGGASGKTGLYAIPVNTTEDGKAKCLRATCYKDTLRNLVGNDTDRWTCVAEQAVEYPLNETEDGKSQTIKAQYDKTSVANICCYSSTYGATGVAQPTEESPCGEFVGDGKDNDAMKRVYEVKDGMITIKGRQYPIKLPDGYYTIRKPTVTECCRLQTLPEQIHNILIDLEKGEISCLDRQKISVQSVEEKCHRLPRFARNALEIDLNEFVQYVEKGLSIKLPQTEKPVLLNVRTSCAGLNSRNDCSKELPKNANNAGKNSRILCAERTEIFAQVIVGISTILEKTTQIGKVVLHQNGNPFAVVENGRMLFLKSTKEIIQLAEDAEVSISKVKKAIAYTISEVLQNTKTLEQTLITLFFFVLNAIGGYILQQTQKGILFSIRTPYTYAVSDSQAYKGLGNGWTAEVIIHILNGALKDVPRDEEIVVLSMYDGIGTGRYCLDKMGFKNVKYYAYEIDKYAMQIAMSNFPDIIQCGDAFQLREENWELGKNVYGKK